jgi:hypothetical protein
MNANRISSSAAKGLAMLSTESSGRLYSVASYLLILYSSTHGMGVEKIFCRFVKLPTQRLFSLFLRCLSLHDSRNAISNIPGRCLIALRISSNNKNEHSRHLAVRSDTWPGTSPIIAAVSPVTRAMNKSLMTDLTISSTSRGKQLPLI